MRFIEMYKIKESKNAIFVCKKILSTKHFQILLILNRNSRIWARNKFSLFQKQQCFDSQTFWAKTERKPKFGKGFKRLSIKEFLKATSRNAKMKQVSDSWLRYEKQGNSFSFSYFRETFAESHTVRFSNWIIKKNDW